MIWWYHYFWKHPYVVGAISEATCHQPTRHIYLCSVLEEFVNINL